MSEGNTADTGSAKIFEDTTTTGTGNRVSEAASNVRERAEELGRRAADKIDESRSPAASKLESAATTIHEKADQLPGGERVTQMAHSTADKLSAAANYMRTHEMKDVVADVERVIRRNPAQSLLAAAAVGFLAGRVFRERE